MTVLQYIVVFAMALGAWGGMVWAMRSGPVSFLRVVVILLCLALMVSAFSLGSYWRHDDLMCHPGQHCFPWGD